MLVLFQAVGMEKKEKMGDSSSWLPSLLLLWFESLTMEKMEKVENSTFLFPSFFIVVDVLITCLREYGKDRKVLAFVSFGVVVVLDPRNRQGKDGESWKFIVHVSFIFVVVVQITRHGQHGKLHVFNSLLHLVLAHPVS